MSDSAAVDRAIRERRSIRAFQPRDVPREMIEDLLDVARWAPSGSNRQPWRMNVATGAAAEMLRERLSDALHLNPQSEEQQQAARERIASGPMAWILDCIEGPADEFLARGSMTFYGAPVALVLSYPGATQASVPAAIPAFVTTLMLAAEARGLGTIWLGWPLGKPEIVRETLRIPADEQLGAFVALGYPDTSAPVNIARSPRDEVTSFTRWIEEV